MGAAPLTAQWQPHEVSTMTKTPRPLKKRGRPEETSLSISRYLCSFRAIQKPANRKTAPVA